MTFIADILLVAGAMAAALYCFVLSRRLRKFTDLENGIGGAIAVLSAQVDDLSIALRRAEKSTAASADGLASQSQSAEAAAKRLELLMASLHDLPEPKEIETPIDPFFVRKASMSEKVR